MMSLAAQFPDVKDVGVDGARLGPVRPLFTSPQNPDVVVYAWVADGSDPSRFVVDVKYRCPASVVETMSVIFCCRVDQ